MPLIADHIRTYSNLPRDAQSLARKYASHINPNWKKINVEKVGYALLPSIFLDVVLHVQMDRVLYHKFTQHRGLREELLATGDADLIEVHNEMDAMASSS
jgi:predicted NAD-dependent protein-ADP-ribosyltransferase YbiA (DUF1768 family)